MKELQDRRVGQQPLQIGGGALTARDLHQMRIAISGGELDDTKPVAPRIKPHGFRIHRNNGAEDEPVGQVIVMQMDGQ